MTITLELTPDMEQQLQRAARAQGKDVVTTREPGGTPEAEELRKLLVSGDTARWTADEELLLNFAARGTHLRNVIVPALQAGTIVICDRFVDSSFVYQCVAGGARTSLFNELVNTIASKQIPDFTFVLDIDPSLAMDRANERNGNQLPDSCSDRYERKGLAFHQKVRDGFIEIVKQQPRRCHLIDADGTPEDVATSVWEKLHG